MERHELFADGIGEISLVGGMVRMDLVALTGSQRDQDNQPKLEFRQRVVKPAMDHFPPVQTTYPRQLQQMWQELCERHAAQFTTDVTCSVTDRVI